MTLNSELSLLLPQRHNYHAVKNEEAKSLIAKYRLATNPREKNVILNRLIEGYMNIVRHLAVLRQQTMKRRGCDVELEDLIQEGVIGLFRAIEHRDLARDEPFVSFAMLLIRQALWRATVGMEKSEIYIPPAMKTKMGLVRRAIGKLKSNHGKHSDETEILNVIHTFSGRAAENFRLRDVAPCLRLMSYAYLSLDAEIQMEEEDPRSYDDILADSGSKTDEIVEAHLALEHLLGEKGYIHRDEKNLSDLLMELDSESSYPLKKEQQGGTTSDTTDISFDNNTWMTVDELHNALGLADLTINKRLSRIAIKTKIGKDRGGRERVFYNYSEVKKACADLLLNTLPLAGTEGTFERNGEIWGSLSAIANKLRKSRRTLRLLKKKHCIRSTSGNYYHHRITTFYSLADFQQCA